MKTECKTKGIRFQGIFRREVLGKFDGGRITSDGGGVLLREVEKRVGIIKRFSECFTDYREQRRIEHSVLELVSQRIYGLALGYEDLNDHDRLRNDSSLALLCGKEDLTGSKRVNKRDKGKALAGKSTLNRLELTSANATEKSRYKKIVSDFDKVDRLLIDIFLESKKKEPNRIILDLDATDDPLHGEQEGRFFHGYYKGYCYLPLYIFCESHLLCARLRTSDNDASKGTLKELERIVSVIREKWKRTEIIIRADSGFCRERIMNWCEENNIGYILGLAKNERLKRMIKEELVEAEFLYRIRGRASRVFSDFQYSTLNSWSKSRRVIGKAEHLAKGSNPRFVVTSIPATEMEARKLYEKQYCARGEMENRIKEKQLMLFADRTSTRLIRSNQIRLYFSSIAYVIMNALRCMALVGTTMEKAQCDTIRLNLLKIGAKVKVTVRKVWLSLSESYPFRDIFMQVYYNIMKIPLPA